MIDFQQSFKVQVKLSITLIDSAQRRRDQGVKMPSAPIDQQLRMAALIAEEDALMRQIINGDIQDNEELMLDNDPTFSGWDDAALKEAQEALIKKLQSSVRTQVIIKDKLNRISTARIMLRSPEHDPSGTPEGSVTTEASEAPSRATIGMSAPATASITMIDQHIAGDERQSHQI